MTQGGPLPASNSVAAWYAANPRAVPRDLLPLPLIPAGGLGSMPSRSRSRRLELPRTAAVIAAANEVIWGLNKLHDNGQSLQHLPPIYRTARSSAQHHLRMP